MIRKKTNNKRASEGKVSKTVKRDKILKAARKIFSEHPYPAASMRMIAREAHIDHPLIIYYFPTKAALFEELLKELTHEFSKAFPDWLNEIDFKMSAAKRISIYLDRAIDFHRKHPEFARITVLNMVQSARSKNLIPGCHHLQKAQMLAAKIYSARSQSVLGADEFSLLQNSFGPLMINYMGAREYYAEIQQVDPESDAYFKWVKENLMFLLMPLFKNKVFPKET